MQHRQGFYEKYVKRLIDIVCSLVVLVLFWWLYIILAVLVRVKLGSQYCLNNKDREKRKNFQYV